MIDPTDKYSFKVQIPHSHNEGHRADVIRTPYADVLLDAMGRQSQNPKYNWWAFRCLSTGCRASFLVREDVLENLVRDASYLHAVTTRS